MKLAIVLLALLPLALSVPEKRLILSGLLDLSQIRSTVSQLAHQFGDDPTEQQCEAGCHNLVLHEESVLHTWCPFVCRSFQELMHVLDIEPTGNPAA